MMPVINKERTACRQEAVMLMSGQYCRDAEASIGDKFYFLKKEIKELQSSLTTERGKMLTVSIDDLMSVIDMIVDEHQCVGSMEIANGIMEKFEGRILCKSI